MLRTNAKHEALHIRLCSLQAFVDVSNGRAQRWEDGGNKIIEVGLTGCCLSFVSCTLLRLAALSNASGQAHLQVPCPHGCRTATHE